MAYQELTIEELKSILRAVAGQGEDVDLDGDILDVPFDDLGYDSLALLEMSGHIERERGVSLPESTVTDAATPRVLLAAVNEQAGPPSAA